MEKAAGGARLPTYPPTHLPDGIEETWRGVQDNRPPYAQRCRGARGAEKQGRREKKQTSVTLVQQCSRDPLTALGQGRLGVSRDAPVLKPVLPVSETLARSTPFRNSSRNSTSPQLADLTSSSSRRCLRQPGFALPCPDPLQSSSLHCYSRPSTPPCCAALCLRSTQPSHVDHRRPSMRRPPTPYPVVTVRYARPRLKHHPQSQERHVCSWLCPCGSYGCVDVWTCERVNV